MLNTTLLSAEHIANKSSSTLPGITGVLFDKLHSIGYGNVSKY